MSTESALCKVCGAAHSLREPHVFAKGEKRVSNVMSNAQRQAKWRKDHKAEHAAQQRAWRRKK